jgi:type II secretory pathway pseudopilin PulG
LNVILRRHRRGFQIIEMVLAMMILSLLTSVMVVTYRGQSQSAAITICKQRLASIRTAIDKWQLEHHRPWFLATPPQGSPRNPWEGHFKVDPVAGRIWTEPPEHVGTSLSLDYTPLSTKPNGSPLIQSIKASGPGLALTWAWPGNENAAVGYRVLRTENPATPFVSVGNVPPKPPLHFTDSPLTPGKVYYYRIEAILGPGDRRTPLPISPLQSRATSVQGSPELELTTSAGQVLVGSAALFRLEGHGVGVGLKNLVFQGKSQPVGPGSFRLDLSWTFASPGVQEVVAVLWDSSGRSTRKTLSLEVL